MASDYDTFSRMAIAELDAIHRLAYHLAGQPQEAEDIAQETFLRAFKSWPSYRPGDLGIRPWLFKILHNVVYSRLSREHREREVLAELQSQIVLDAPPPPEQLRSSQDDCTVEGIDWEGMDGRLKQALLELSLDQRTVFLLCAAAELSYREIAEVIGVPVGTVMSRLYRARTILAARLAPLASEEGLGREKKSEARN